MPVYSRLISPWTSTSPPSPAHVLYAPLASSPQDGERIKQHFLNRLQERGIPKGGLDVDLVDATNHIYPMPLSYEDAKSEREDDSCMTVIYSSISVDATLTMAARYNKTGMQCERPPCKAVSLPAHFVGAGFKLKRCGKCLQVNYCGDECQREDWPRHKQYCFPAQPGITTKDGLLAGARALLACPTTLWSLMQFAVVTLNLDTNPEAAHHRELVVHCTSIPDSLRGVGRIFQVSRVTLSPWNAPDDDTSDPFCRFTFKSDAPGAEGPLLRAPPLSTRVLTMARKQDPGAPIAFLLTVNGLIRMDVDDVFNFRMQD